VESKNFDAETQRKRRERREKIRAKREAGSSHLALTIGH